MAQDIEHMEQTAWVANALYYEYMSAANPHIPPSLVSLTPAPSTETERPDSFRSTFRNG